MWGRCENRRMKDFNEFCKMKGITIRDTSAEVVLFEALYDLIVDTRRNK